MPYEFVGGVIMSVPDTEVREGCREKAASVLPVEDEEELPGGWKGGEMEVSVP